MRIVMLEPLGIKEELLQKLSSALAVQGHEFIAHERSQDPSVLIGRVKNADVLIVSNLPLKGEVIRSAASLKMISVAFTGIDHIDAKACEEKGITVCNAAGYSTNSVAELTFCLMLDVLRKVIPCDTAVRNGGAKAGLIGNELAGKTVGIVGTGAIGMRVAEIANAFGCKLLGCSRTERKTTGFLGLKYVPLDELMACSDIVTLHTPLTQETKHLVDRERISLMKPTGILINTARGPVVDSAALAEALNNGVIAGAGIDVYETEPPLGTDHPLLNAKNVVATPHIAFATHEAMEKRAGITFDNITKWMEGDPKNVMIG
jgi:phosphoglycerate dehydrogenase-like enzyme